jgi:hypothetical protein
MATWKIIKRETTNDGHIVEMRYAEFGKGRAKLRKWEIYRDGTEAGYAVNASDAEVNFGRVLAGFVRNRETGNYEPAEVPAPAVICGYCDREFPSKAALAKHQRDETARDAESNGDRPLHVLPRQVSPRENDPEARAIRVAAEQIDDLRYGNNDLLELAQWIEDDAADATESVREYAASVATRIREKVEGAR